MKTSNLKDILTTIAGVIGGIGAVGGVIIAVCMQQHLTIPVVVLVIEGCCVGIPSVLIGLVSGKNPDLSTKTTVQINQQMNSIQVDNAIAAFAKVNGMTTEQCSIKCEDNIYLNNVLQWYATQTAVK